MIQLLDLTLLAPPFDPIEPPPPSTSELEVQFERVRSAYNLLGDELDRLASMVAVRSMGDTGSIASDFVDALIATAGRMGDSASIGAVIGT